MLGIAREAAWLEHRVDEVRNAHFQFTEEHPQVPGVIADAQHGGYSVTAVFQNQADFKDDVIMASLTPEQLARVYHQRRTEITFVFDGEELVTADGTHYSAQKAAQMMRHSLLGGGIEEGLVDEKHLASKIKAERDIVALAEIIDSGVFVPGITITPWRQEVRALDKFAGIHFDRQPRRRKNLITPRNKPRTTPKS